MARKLSRQEVLDTIIDALNDCGVYGADDDAEQAVARQVLKELEAEGVIDEGEVEQ